MYEGLDGGGGLVFPYIFIKNINFLQLGTLFCALVDCNHNEMTALSKYSGSLACI